MNICCIAKLSTNFNELLAQTELILFSPIPPSPLAIFSEILSPPLKPYYSPWEVQEKKIIWVIRHCELKIYHNCKKTNKNILTFTNSFFMVELLMIFGLLKDLLSIIFAPPGHIILFYKFSPGMFTHSYKYGVRVHYATIPKLGSYSIIGILPKHYWILHL